MQFGIMAMQMDELIPTATAPDQILAAVMNFDYPDLVRRLAGRGFNPIELAGDLMLFFPNAYGPASVAALAQLQAQQNLRYTMHLPLWSVEPSTPLTAVREGSLKALIAAIRATQSLNIERYVLHATGALAAEFSQMRLPPQGKAVLLRQFQTGAEATIRTLLEETGLPSRRLAIETIEFPFELTWEIAEQLDLSICLDTGHLLAGFSGPVELFTVLEQILPRLGEIHLHDCPWQGPEHHIGYGKDHQPLGAGDLDTARLLDSLDRAGFTGPIIFELTVDQALASLETIRRVCPQYLPA